MATMTEKAHEVLAPHLEPGEAVLAAVGGQLDGGTMRLAKTIGFASGMGGIAGGVIASHLASGGSELEAELASGVVVAVTTRRVVLLSVTKVGANPKALVASIDRTKITGVTAGTKKVMLVKIPTFALSLAGADGPAETLAFESHKVAKHDAAAVVAALGA